ncbi:MAG: hypothetical protein ORN50_07760 [Crocinitomicaceae bacterium]|nr:hypothetical protein [Crocinitomicaceae bacterium]
MSEVTKKTKQARVWSIPVVDRLNIKYGLTKHYIRMCLRGDRNNETADLIRKDYAAMCKEVEAVLNK